jgi:hypothetical protein
MRTSTTHALVQTRRGNQGGGVRYDGLDEGPYEDEVRASLECMRPYKTCMSQHVSLMSGKMLPIILPLQGTLCFLTSSVVVFSLIHLQRIF